jgi:acyl dehydratase
MHAPKPVRHFEDFSPGEVIALGQKTVTAAEIIEFATEFDPAPYHLSEEGGRNSMLGRLSASGWHACAMLMRMIVDNLLANSTSQGAPGIDLCRWLRPIAAGTTIRATATVLSMRRSAKRPEIGFVQFRFHIHDAAGDGSPESALMMLEVSNMFRLRHPGAAA